MTHHNHEWPQMTNGATRVRSSEKVRRNEEISDNNRGARDAAHHVCFFKTLFLLYQRLLTGQYEWRHQRRPLQHDHDDSSNDKDDYNHINASRRVCHQLLHVPPPRRRRRLDSLDLSPGMFLFFSFTSFFTFITLSTGVYGMGSTTTMTNGHLVHLHRTGPLATNLEVQQQQGLNKDSGSRRSCILILNLEYVSFFAFVTLLTVFFIRLIIYQQHMTSHNEVPNNTLPSFGPPPITPLLFRMFFPLFSPFLGLFF